MVFFSRLLYHDGGLVHPINVVHRCVFMFQIVHIMKSSVLKTPTCFGCVPIGSQVGSFQVHHHDMIHVKKIISVFRILSVFCISDRST